MKKLDLEKRKLILVIIVGLMIFICSSMSDLSAPQEISFSYFDKVAHFFIFGLFATTVIRLKYFSNFGRIKSIIFVSILVGLYGVIDEYHQSLTPNRYFEYADMLADATGAFIASVSYSYIKFYRNFLEKNWKK